MRVRTEERRLGRKIVPIYIFIYIYFFGNIAVESM